MGRRKQGTAATQASIQVTSPPGNTDWEKGKRYELGMLFKTAGLHAGSTLKGDVVVQTDHPDYKKMVLPVTVQNTGPMLPTIPACSQ